MRIAASGSHDRTVKIWCLETKKNIRTIDFSDFVWRVFLVIGSKGNALVVAFISVEDKIIVSDVETGETKCILFGRLVFAGLIPLYSSPVVILSTGQEDISFVDVESGNVCGLIQGGFDKVFRAVVSHEMPAILVFTTWNHQTRRSTIQTYSLCEEKIPTSTESLLVSSSVNSSSYVKSMEPTHDKMSSDRMKIMFEGDSRNGVTSLAVSRSEQPFICSGHYDYVVRVWDLIQRKLLFTLQGHTDWVLSVAIWKGVEPLAVSGSADGLIKVWDLQTGALLTTCEGHQRDIWSVTVTEGPNPLIVSASIDRTMRTWDINQFLNDLKWERRKNFCIVIYCCGLLDREKGMINSDSSFYLRDVSDTGEIPPSDSFISEGRSSDTSAGEGTEKETNQQRSVFDDHNGNKDEYNASIFVSTDSTIPTDNSPSLILEIATKNAKEQASYDLESFSESNDYMIDKLRNIKPLIREPFELVFQSIHLCREIASFI
jgi:WD40 repeat protein